MKRLVFLAAMASSCLLGCGGSADSSNDPLSTGGTGGFATSSGGGSGQSGRGNGGSSGTAMRTGGAANGGAANGGTATGGSGGDMTTRGGAGDKTTGGSAGNGGTTSSGGAAGSPCGCQSLEQCWMNELCVAKLVAVPAGFSIDATEVTRGQYAAWLALNPSMNGQDSVCTWNTSFAPDTTCMAKASVCQGPDCGQHPQPCVDLCDAVAYCKAIDKRLCSAIGGGSVTNYSDASSSQWYNACTSNGVNRFVYGNSVGEGRCHDSMDYDSYTTTIPVASMPECQSQVAGYAGILDLLGNLWEWEDNCTVVPPATVESCKLRGMSFGISAMSAMCDVLISQPRANVRDNVGFRCCSP